MQKKSPALLFLYGFSGLTVVLALWFAWVDLNEIIHAISGRPTEWAQMTYMTDGEIIAYSSVYMASNITLNAFVIYSFYKDKKRQAIVFVLLIWAVMLIGLYTDAMTAVAL